MSSNTCQVEEFQNNLRVYLWQFSPGFQFFFFEMMVIDAWSWYFVELLSRPVCQLTISFPHISWHDLPCRRTTKRCTDFPSMVIFQLPLPSSAQVPPTLLLSTPRNKRLVDRKTRCLLSPNFRRLWSSGSSPAHPSGFRGAPRGDYLSTRSRLSVESLFNLPIRFPQHLFSVHHGRQRSERGRSTFPALTLAWLYIEPSPCGGVRPAGDPVDGDPGAIFKDDPHPGSGAGRPLEPWVCHHTREPTVLSRVSCRPSHLKIDRFHQPCLIPGRTSRIGEDCRFPVPRGSHLPFLGSPTLPPSRLTGGLCHADMTVPRQDVNSSFLPACATPQRSCVHTRRIGTIASPPPPVDDMPWGPHPPGHHQFCDFVPFSLWFAFKSRIPLLFCSRSEEWPSSWWESFRINRNETGD